MRRIVLLLLFSVLMLFGQERFIVLCYHNITDNPQDPDIMSISTAKFIQQLHWLHDHGYHPISIDDLIEASKHRKKLPPKAILLSFDDAYRDFYTRVYPILKAFNYPAVLAVVGKWEEADGEEFRYGDRRKSKKILMGWREIKEMSDSGLIEIASHTYDLHHGVLANPQGNMEPAATTRIYDPKSGSYEDDHAYYRRIESDIERSSDIIYQKTGKRSRVLVWPYGQYNAVTLEIAKKHGMPITFTLDDGINTLADLDRIKRVLIYSKDTLADFVWRLQNPEKEPPQRVVHVDLDYIYDKDPRQQERNLGRLLDRIKAFKISTVYLQAFADPDGDGTADALYFPNSVLPVRADLFNRVAWQLLTRCGVEVYAWMPVSAFALQDERLYVKKYDPTTKSYTIDPDNPKRLSIFDPRARRVIKKIYEDLAKSSHFQGILFHDDAFLSDFEDGSEAARRYYAKMGLGDSIAQIRSDPQKMRMWTALKTDALIAFTQELKKVVEKYRQPVKTARNIYALPVLEPRSEEWFAQNFDKFLDTYDYTAIMAMPYMEGARDPLSWLATLTERVKLHKNARKKSLFELQSKDWRSGRFVDEKILHEEIELLQNAQIENYGYYPDDFLRNHPDFAKIYPQMSLNTNPFIRR